MNNDHRKRILEHQEKVMAEKRDSKPDSADRQLKFPLIGEVRPPAESAPARHRARRSAKPSQPRLDET
jgi:hypothetical protein